MTIANKLNKLLETKENIRQAIIDKGVEVTEDTIFADYPNKISSIEAGGSDPYYEEFYNLRTNNGTNMDALFARTTGELDLRKVDTSNVTSMKYMFDYSTATVNIDGWDTSNVADMNMMFNNFTGSIDISKLDTSKVTNVSYMFNNANTDKIILTGMSFPKCTKLENMFYGATGTELDLSSWDISNITNMGNMFTTAKYTRIDLSGWNTSHVTNMSQMFYTYSNPLEELIIPNWDMSNVSTNIFYNGSYISKLMLIDLSQSNDATIAKIASYLPKRTTTTFGKILVPYDTSQAAFDALVAKYWAPMGASMTPLPTSVQIVSDLDEILPGKSRKTKVYLGTYDPWNGDPSKTELAISDSSIATMDENNIITTTGVLGDIIVQARIKDTEEVIGEKIIPVTETDSYPNLIKFRLSSTPASYTTIITVNGSSDKILSNLTYDSITDIYSYDHGAPITRIKFGSSSNINELIKLNTSNVTNMSNMFNTCQKLTTLDLSTFDTNKVTTMAYMFQNCRQLTTLDVSNFNTSNVTDMSCMFYNCTNLTSLDLSSFDTSNATTMDSIFYGCTNLTNLKAPQNISVALSLSQSPLLTHESLMSVINNLATITTTKTLTLGTTNLAKLSDEEKAIATNKGWTLR